MRAKMIALLALITLASACMAQIPLPYSLHGNFTNVLTVSPVSPEDYIGCYVAFEGSENSAKWIEICRDSNTVEEQQRDSVVLSELTVSACGQNHQLGLSYGVFGGFLSHDNHQGGEDKVPACVYFQRVDGEHRNGLDKNAFANLTVFTPTAPVNGTTVTCPAVLPTGDFAKPNVDMTLTGFFTCASGTCYTDKLSSYCSKGDLHNVYQIGIGMGIGGVGLLVVTFVLIFIISTVSQG